MVWWWIVDMRARSQTLSPILDAWNDLRSECGTLG